MTDPDTAALAEQVREAIAWQLYPEKPLAALATLVARLQAVEDQSPPTAAEWHALHDRLEVAERERDELWEFNQKLAADHYFARAEAAEAALRLFVPTEIEGRYCLLTKDDIAQVNAALRDTASGK